MYFLFTWWQQDCSTQQSSLPIVDKSFLLVEHTSFSLAKAEISVEGILHLNGTSAVLAKTHDFLLYVTLRCVKFL